MAKSGTPSPQEQGRKKAGDRQPSASARRAERARVALYEATDAHAFAKAVFRLMLATVIGDHACAMFHCTPAPEWGAWLASNGSTMSAEMMLEVSKIHLGIPVLLANPGIKIIPTRGVLPPEEELVRTPFFQRHMVPYGWRHAVALFFWQSLSPPALDCVFSINRTAAQGDFSREEIARIETLHPEIERARRRVARLEEQRGALDSLQHFIRDLPMPAVLLNWKLEPLYSNREGIECCARWKHGAAARALNPTCELHPALLAGCAAMKEGYAARRGESHPARSVRKHTVRHPTAPEMAASISTFPIEPALLGDPNFLIVFQNAGPSEPERPTLTLAHLARLTPRQREIAALAVEGRTNSEIAAALRCSLATVKNGLYAAFQRLSVSSRAQLVRKLVA